MTRKEAIRILAEHITKVRDSYLALTAAQNAAIAAGCFDINGPFFDAMWRHHDTLLEACDVDGWLSYFLHDCQCGKNPLEVRRGTKVWKMRTPREVASMMLETFHSLPEWAKALAECRRTSSNSRR